MKNYSDFLNHLNEMETLVDIKTEDNEDIKLFKKGFHKYVLSAGSSWVTINKHQAKELVDALTKII